MEFAGNDLIYLSKIKKEKVEKYKKIEKPNEKMKVDNSNSEDSDEEYLSVDSNNFNIDLEKSQLNSPMNLNAAPGVKFKKAIDTNACVIRYKALEEEPESCLPQFYQCKKCNAYLNKYSKLIPMGEKNKYEWKCEFCFNINKDLFIEELNLPTKECIEKTILEPPTIKEENKEDDDSSLIFCLDNSGSMSAGYEINKELSQRFKKIRGSNISRRISRLEMVKLSVENIINSLLKKSPKVKVGLVTFASQIKVKGDCLSNVIIVKDLDNESKLQSLGKENTNLIKTGINESSNEILKSLREIKEEGNTALGPAVLLSLSLLNEAKKGSRIFVCTDGQSNEGIGNLYNTQEAIHFYTKIGNIAKAKGVVISLITFEDSESLIDILKPMVENSGGDIFRVNPEYILDEVNDFLENKAIASDVEIQINLNKSMTFRDEEKKDLKNDNSTIINKIGNVTKEKESYFELKFKNAKKLADIHEINFNELNNLIFQSVIFYSKKNGGKYIRIITKNLKVSDNKEEIIKKANLNIISTLQIQKSAKLAGKGKLMDAQAQIHIARNFLNNNINFNNNLQIYNQFNSNMNNFNNNLSNMNMNNMMMNNMNMNNMMRMNNMMMNNMNNNMNMNNMMMNNMNMNNNMNNMNMNNMMMNNMNNMMMNNNMNNMNMNNMMMNNNMNNMMMNNMNNMNNDLISGQIYNLSNTSENRQNMMYQRNKK